MASNDRVDGQVPGRVGDSVLRLRPVKQQQLDDLFVVDVDGPLQGSLSSINFVDVSFLIFQQVANDLDLLALDCVDQD